MITLATEPISPVRNFAALRQQAALRFFFLVGSPLFIWVLAQMEWPIQTLGQLIKAALYAVMSFEVWLSAPEVCGPLLTGFVVLWLALTTQSVLSMAELHAAPTPDEEAVTRGLAIYRRNLLMQRALGVVLGCSLVIALFSWLAKVVYAVSSDESLTIGLAFALLGLALLAVSPVANIVLPKALRQPWRTEEGKIRALAAIKFFEQTPWSNDGCSATWSLPQYGLVLLHDLARRAGALDQLSHALNLDTAACNPEPEDAND